MTKDEIFEIAHHFYRLGFFTTKEGQFKKHFDEYMELCKQDEALLQADVIKSLPFKCELHALGQTVLPCERQCEFCKMQ